MTYFRIRLSRGDYVSMLTSSGNWTESSGVYSTWSTRAEAERWIRLAHPPLLHDFVIEEITSKESS